MSYVDINGNQILLGGNVLSGKKWACVGDSVTYGATAGTAPDGQLETYEYYIAKRNGMNLYKDGISGSILGISQKYQDGEAEIEYKSPFSHQRYLNVPTDCDYLTIWFGINDSALYASNNGGNKNYVALGTISDSEPTTFYGAWNKVLTHFIQTMPNCKIGLVVSHVANVTYAQAVRDVAKKYGLKVFDIPNDPNIPYWASNSYGYRDVDSEIASQRQSNWWTNNSHPNSAGYEYISYPFEAWLRSL